MQDHVGFRLGTTTLPLAGWMADPRRSEESQQHRLAVIRQLVEGYGLSAVELTLDLGIVYPQIFNASFYGAVADLQQELGFACTVHLPFLWVDPASLNERIRQASMDCMRQAIALTRPVDVATYVFHLWGLATTLITAQLQHFAERQAILEVVMAQAGRSLAELCEIIEPRDLCVENLEDPLFDLAVEAIEDQGASICLDVGHLTWQVRGELEFLALHQDRIREVHLHDAVSASAERGSQPRDHLSLGEGEVDYVTFLRKLLEIGFDGAVILELNSQADLERSLERLSEFL